MSPSRCVVDTSAWIEWLSGSPVGRQVQASWPDWPLCIVPTVVQLELAKWILRGVEKRWAERVMAYTEECVVAPLDTTIALMAAELHRKHKLATADAIVYATARYEGAGLLTCDAHFKGLQDIIYVRKGA